MKKKMIVAIVLLQLITINAAAQKDSIHKEVSLKEVVIMADRQKIKFSPKGTTYKIDGIVAQSGSLFDAIASLPGVSIDNEGNLTINGKNGGEILIDGRPTYLSGSELATLLRTMTATEADKIDVITQPSAKYDAAGISGLIDIHSKKIKLLGMNLNTNMNGSIGRCGGGYASVAFNYKTKHWNPYASYSHYNHKHVVDLKIDRAFQQERMMQNSMRNYHIKNHDIRLGCDYMPDNLTTINAYIKSGLNKNVEDATMKSMTQQTHKGNGNTSNADKNLLNLTTGVNFQKRYGDEGVWSGSADYFLYHSDQQQNLYSEVPDTTIGDMTSRIHILQLKTDLTLPLNKVWNMEGGLKMSNVRIRNDFKYSMAKTADMHFYYDEDTYAAYLQANYQRGKWKLTAGLRSESTYYHIYSQDKTAARDSTTSMNKTNLFPSLQLAYSLSEEQSLLFSYSKRITRPKYSDLNPFIYIFDDYTVESGNTELRPSFSHNIEVSYQKLKIGQITALLSVMNDALMKGFEIDENERVKTFRCNFSDYFSTGLRYQTMQDITKHWTASAFLACIYNRYKWMEDGIRQTNGRMSPMLSITQTYNFPHSFSSELKVDYQGKMVYGQVTLHSSSTINISLQKKICGGNGVITLFANDIFDGQREKLSMVIGGHSAWCQTLNHIQAIGISFSWKFKKGADIKEKKQKNAIDEINRVNL